MLLPVVRRTGRLPTVRVGPTDMRGLFLLTLAALSGCASRSACALPGAHAPVGRVVIEANGIPVTDRMVDLALKDMPPQQREALVKQGAYDSLVENIALGEVLYQKALAENLQDDPEVALALALGAREQLASAWLRKAIEGRVSDDAVRAYYDENADRFAQPEVKASHILVEGADEAAVVLQRLEAGEDFAALADELSIDSGSPHGELGWFERDRMVEPFADAAFAAEVGSTVGPVETRFGFHVIRVEDRREATPLEDVRDAIREELRRTAARELFDEVQASVEFTRPADKVHEGD